MRNKYVLGLLVILAGVVIGVVSFMIEDPTAESVAVSAPDNAFVMGAEPEAQLSSPSVPKPELEREPVARVAGDARMAEPSSALASIAEDELRWIEGRLLLPDNASWDPTAVAISVAAPERKKATRALFQFMIGGASAPTEETDVLYKSGFGKDGSFRLGCAPDAEWAYLDIDARFLYLVEPIAVRLDGPVTSIDLTPLLGANIQGQWRASEDASAVEREFTGGAVYLTTVSDRGIPAIFGGKQGGDRSFHRTWVAADGSFEMRGVNPEIEWTAVSLPPRLASDVSEALVLVPGEELQLEIELKQGSRLSGRVEDRKGKPLFGARLFVTTSDEELGFQRSQLMSREGRSRGDGSFDLYGIAPGEVRLNVELKGYRTPIRKKYTLVPGSEETDIVFTMRRGKALRGEIAWSDGTAASMATVEVGKDASGKPNDMPRSWRSRYGETVTDQAGQFEVVGLKSRKSSIWAWATRQEQGRWIEGVARLDGVKPSESSELRLVLTERPIVTGFVTDVDGQPVQDFEIEVRVDDGASNMFSAMSRQGQEEQRSFHALDGAFVVERLGRGDYVISVIADGFATSKPLGFVVPFELDTPPLEIRLSKFSSVTGIVTTPTGGVAVGATVIARTSPAAEVSMLMELQAPMRTKANGRGEYRFSQLSPGPIFLFAENDEWVQSAEIELELEPGSDQLGVELALRTGASLTVEVLDDEGQHTDEYVVNVEDQNSTSENLFDRSDSSKESLSQDGWVEFHGLTPGTATVSARKLGSGERELWESSNESMRLSNPFRGMGRIVTANVELLDGATAHVVLGGKTAGKSGPVRLTGRVTRRGEPIQASLSFVYDGEFIDVPNSDAKCDAEGAYEVELSIAGDYHVAFGLPGEEDQSGQQNRFCRVYPGESQSIDFRLHAGRISGRVYNPKGELAKEIPLSIRRMENPRVGEDSFGAVFRNRVVSDENGEYAFDALEAGTYIVSAGSSMFTLVIGSAGGFGRKLSDPVQLDEDQERADVDLFLSSPVQLKGDVVDGDGNPVGGATVFVFDSLGVAVDTFSSTTSNVSGRFIYEGLSEGEYTAMARTKTMASTYSDLVKVGEGVETRIKLELAPATVLMIELLDDKGSALPATVGVIDDKGRRLNGLLAFGSQSMFFRQFETDSKVTRVGPVSPGSYVVTARAEGHAEVSRKIVVERSAEAEQQIELRLPE